MDGTTWGAWSDVRSFTADTTAAGDVWLQTDGPQFSQDSLVGAAVAEAGTLSLLQSLDTTDHADSGQGAQVLAVSSSLAGYPAGNLIGPGDLIFGSNDLDQWAKIELADTTTIGLLGSTQWVGQTDRPVWSDLEILTSLDDATYQSWVHVGPLAEPSLQVPSVLLAPSPTGQPQPVRYLLCRFGQGLQTQGALWGSRVHEVRAFSLVYPDTGTAWTPSIGPASSWQGLSWGETLPAGTDVEVDVLGWTGGAWTVLAGYGGLTNATGEDLSGIDAGQNPYIRLVARLITGNADVTPSMEWLRVGFALLQRKGDLYSLKFDVPDDGVSVLEGESLVEGATVGNTGDTESGAIRVEVTLEESVVHSEVVALSPGQEADVPFEVPGALAPGCHEVRMVASSARGVEAEKAWTIRVAPDTIPPAVLLSSGDGMLEALVADRGTGPDPTSVSCNDWEPPGGFEFTWRLDTLVVRGPSPSGPRTVWMQIADNRGNVAASAPLELSAGIESIEHMWCHPNPSPGRTDFCLFDADGGLVSAAEIEVTLYTLSGADVRRLSAMETSRLSWDGEDAEGDPVANGVYLFRVEARDGSGASVKSFGRLVVRR